MDDKVCKHCGTVKPLTEFHGDRAAADGRRPECNQGLGKFEEDPALLERAAAYLRAAQPGSGTA